VLDSCGGFYGASHAIAEGQQMLETVATEFRQSQAEAFVAKLEAERPDLTPPGL